MSLRRKKHPDSLELLLDTMCNTFGGIIMIALLIALLSRDASSEASVAQRAETLRAQAEQLQRQIREAEQLQKSLTGQISDPSAARALNLLTRRDELQKQIEESQRILESNTAHRASLTATNNPADVERLIAEKAAQSAEAQTLNDQIQKENQLRQRQLRLPRERNTGKKTYYFIVRFGKIYPVHIMRDGRREINMQSLEWRSTPNGETAAPKPDAGLDAAAGLQPLARLFNDIPGQVYSIHFLVYADSFPAFLAARQIPLQRGFDTGWEFLPEDRPIIFSARGEAPPAL